MTTMIPVLKIEDKHKSRQCGYNPTVFVNNGPYDESRRCDGESVLDMDSVNSCFNNLFDCNLDVGFSRIGKFSIKYVCGKCGRKHFVKLSESGLKFELMDLSEISKDEETYADIVPKNSDYDILIKINTDEFVIASVWLTEEDRDPWRLQVYQCIFNSSEAECYIEEILEDCESLVYELSTPYEVLDIFLEYCGIDKINTPRKTRVFDEFEKALSYLKNKNINDIAYIQLKK